MRPVALTDEDIAAEMAAEAEAAKDRPPRRERRRREIQHAKVRE